MVRLSSISVWPHVRRWGWPGAAGVALLVIAALLASIWLPHLTQQNRSLSLAADKADQQLRRAKQGSLTTTASISPAQRFTAAFPDPELREARVAALLALARSHGLSVQRGEFRLTPEPQIGLLKYSVNLPLSGSYEQLRALIEDTQSRDTAVALERLRLQRSSARATRVDADLTLSFYMRAPADAQASPTPAAKAAPESAPAQ
jgi:hypothetical protein